MAKAKVSDMEFGGEVRSFKFGINEAREWESHTGQNMAMIPMLTQTGRFNITMISYFLFVGLKHSWNGLTINKVCDMMEGKEYPEYMKKITEAYSFCFMGIPTDIEKNEDENESAGEETGKK